MDFKNFILLLMTKPWAPEGSGYEIRKAFLRDPEAFMDLHELRDPVDRAFVCSLRSEEIAQRAKIDPDEMKLFKQYMSGEGKWPPPGDITKHYWEDPAVCGREGPSLMWSEPEHKIITVFTPNLYLREDNEFVVMGEGFLPCATMTFVQLGEHDAPFEFPPLHIGGGEDSYHSCSIRQVYMRAIVRVPEGAPKGSYAVWIKNLGWAQTPERGREHMVMVRGPR